MPYLASDSRYSSMTYNRVGRSGLKLPAISLGWWYNFGGRDHLENGRAIARRAFDLGVTHFDLAKERGQSLAQMAIAWTLRKPAVTSALIGASSVEQLENNLAALNNLQFSEDELQAIEKILKS